MMIFKCTELRKALKNITEEALIEAMSKRRIPPQERQTHKRNKSILLEFKKGKTYSELSREYSLSAPRIADLVKGQLARTINFLRKGTNDE